MIRSVAPEPSRRRRMALLASLSCIALLAGCGAEDEVLSGEFDTITPNPGGTGMLGAYFMASITDEWRAAAANIRDNVARYRRQNGTFTIGGTPVFANPLFSSRVDYAHAVGLSGAGEVIAVVDNGFRRTHEAFAGKTNSVTGSPSVEDHGTMVASIAAGDSASMVGVAPDADLAFGSYDSYETLTAAANNATARGAVAQNNSWGFVGTPVSAASYADIFGNSAGQTWLNALSNYAANGVVVFAISNDNAATTAGLMEALPLLEPSLESAWIAVGNAVPVFDDTGVSAAGARYSAQCLEAAAWCIMADGFWIAADAASNTAYESGTGTSFAAPQVSGALALLAEAFPGLTNHQLRARLLAAADNTFTGFVSAGATDLLDGPGTYLHDYSTEHGHGFLDIRAALLPIGTTVLATADGGTIDTRDFAFATGGALGDAVTRSLEGVDLTVTDDLAGGFDVAAKSFAATARPGNLATAVAARAMSKDFKAARTAPLHPLADTFAAHPGQTLDLNGPDGQTRAAVLISGTDSYGVAVARTLTEGDLKVDLGVKFARDGGTVMGFSDAGGATMAALTLGLSNDIGTGGFFALSGEIGIADLGAPAAMASVSAAGFNSVSFDVGSRDVFASGDRIVLGVSMPVAVTSGSADMIVPVALGEGATELRALGIDLSPAERQVDISISYQMPMSDTSELLFEIIHAENYGNVAGLSDSAAIIGMKWAF